MTEPPGEDFSRNDAVSPVGEAFTWVSRITGVGLGMALPAVAGSWLDARFGTRFLGPAGLVLGFVSALVWIVRLGNSAPGIGRTAGHRRLPPPGEPPA